MESQKNEICQQQKLTQSAVGCQAEPRSDDLMQGEVSVEPRLSPGSCVASKKRVTTDTAAPSESVTLVVRRSIETGVVICIILLTMKQWTFLLFTRNCLIYFDVWPFYPRFDPHLIKDELCRPTIKWFVQFASSTLFSIKWWTVLSLLQPIWQTLILDLLYIWWPLEVND